MTAFLRTSARAVHLLCITFSMLLLAYVLNSRVEEALLQGRVPVRYVSPVARPAAPLAQPVEQPGSDGPVLQRFSCGTDSQPGQPEAGREELVWEGGEHHCRSAYSDVVRQLGPQRFAVALRRDKQDEKQARIDRYCLAREVRIVPDFQNGLCHGFKLFSIKPESLSYQLGLRSGDIVRRINGKNLDSPEKALELYIQLKDASRVELLLERDGKPLRHTYLIQK